MFAAAALVGCMVPGVALADDASTSGTGTETKTTDSIEVQYTKDCAWTATYPTQVTMSGSNTDGASADITFTVKGDNYIDVDHAVTITPTSESIALTGTRHGGSLSATITGGKAKAADVNTSAGATVTGSVSATAEAVTGAAVDEYKGTTTFSIKCAMDKAVYTVQASANATNKTLTSDDLGTETTSLTVGGDDYTLYKGIWGKTAGWSYSDAQNFVDELNSVKYGEHSTWQLLPYADDDTSMAAIKSAIGTNTMSGVYLLWSSTQYAYNTPYQWHTVNSYWTWSNGSKSDTTYGFVVCYKN